ncbi:SDR family NAD(P)-dependent oxidoreductase [Mycobacterium sp. CVI_P3]|uniref:SDR family NAD(P)-dependent oxidoreductase n=1 Tax=Mycobacterium pinniadriaticum TaxID=2994102 RepID=A0ABT3SMY5_9MYCO|nr:SDR family NAD(P)-dependent oxidoreductase [Mycobacterium pinniadriaticum]MCX2934457.1 SDR family NAD(P)-dependent oxidoreductase [Mycobacterium pinniadriaticum]MCX2940880.1 SDR family NAD(P)-dependent oxidoreductase [Mycobacterium pinniadriaticum]
MEPAGKVIVVTGGAAGMGEAMCRRFAALGAAVVVADIDAPRTALVAEEIGGLGVVTDVSDEAQVIELVQTALAEFGRIDVFVSNAGVLWGEPHDGVTPLHERGNPWASNQAWQRVWDVNVMPQVYAARAVLPHMVERASGYLIQNASAAGLLTALGNAPYATSKHAVLGLTEWLSIHYGGNGIRVSCVVAEGVRTAMLRGAQGEWFAVAGAITAEEAADCVVEGMRKEQFLILTHPQVEKYFRGKAADYDEWIAKMRKLHAKTPGLAS